MRPAQRRDQLEVVRASTTFSTPGPAPPSVGEAWLGAPGAALAWADWTRIIAMAAVVVLHSAAPLVRSYPADPLRWWVGNLYDSSVRWCVPVFVMLSGALLLGRERPLGDFLKRRLRRTLIPLVAWSAIYFVWATQVRGRAWSLVQLPSLFVQRPIYYHLWFFYLIVGLYLLAPILGGFLRSDGARGARYLIGLWAVWACVLPLVQAATSTHFYFGPDSISSPINLCGYFVLGAVLREVRLGRRGTAAAAAVLVLSIAATAAGTYLLTIRHGGKFDGLLYEYSSINVALMSVAMFLVVRGRAAFARRSSSPALRTVSGSVLGVYLVHAMVIDLFKSGLLGLRIDESLVHPIVGVPLFASMVFALSLLVVLALRRLPLLSELVP